MNRSNKENYSLHPIVALENNRLRNNLAHYISLMTNAMQHIKSIENSYLKAQLNFETSQLFFEMINNIKVSVF